MEFFDHVKFLGMYWGEPGMQPLVDTLKISKPPKIAKGDRTGHLLFKKLGLELTFKDERFVKIPNKVFPEGSVVLCNIRFYLTDEDAYKPYAGALPTCISPNATKVEVLQGLGIPNFPKYSPAGKLLPDEDDWKMRWDKNSFVIFCTFNDEGTATDIALQLPLDQA
jgi:hypothetical protein